MPDLAYYSQHNGVASCGELPSLLRRLPCRIVFIASVISLCLH